MGTHGKNVHTQYARCVWCACERCVFDNNAKIPPNFIAKSDYSTHYYGNWFAIGSGILVDKQIDAQSEFFDLKKKKEIKDTEGRMVARW